MKIESPLFALNALGRTQKALDRALERLSSGQRINSASDDPAGLSIATGLDAQLRGINQGILNINESFGFLATAEGSIATQVQITQRMRELAVNAATGTLSKTDRLYINTEFQQLLSEFNRIAEQTYFNGTSLLDGTFNTSNIQVGASANQVIPFTLSGTLSNLIFPTGGTSTSTSTTGNGTFQAGTSFSAVTGSFPYDNGVRAADFNGDGKLDLLVAGNNNTSGSVNLMLGNGDGTFQAATTISSPSDAHDIEVGDFNGDGKEDFVVLNQATNKAIVFLGNGNGTFAAPSATLSVGSAPWTAAIGDINGDSKADLIVGNPNTANLSIYLGNGNGTFQAVSTISTSNGNESPGTIQLVDVNGDGKLDVVAAEGAVDPWLSVWLGNGNGTFQAEKTFVAGTSFAVEVKTGDVNGDGKLDAVVFNSVDSTVSILLGNGDGTFQARTTVAVGVSGGGAKGLVLQDLNGDGKLDIAVNDDLDNTLSILLGNGNGTFHARTTIAVASTTPFGLIAADFNKDGATDLLEGDHNGGNLEMFLGNTQTTTTTTGTYTPLDISTQANASNVLSVLDSGLTNLNQARSSIGAYQSRLQYALNLNQITAENIASAKSQILDTDVASATSELVKDQILLQAGVAVLGQANLQNQLLLKLLNF